MKSTLGGKQKGEGRRGKAEGEMEKGNEQVISKRYCLVHRPLNRSGKAMGVR